MIKVLFIDPICPEGHINLNKNFVSTLLSLGIHIDFIVKEGYSSKIGIPIENVKYSLSDKVCDEHAGSFKLRYNIFRILWSLKRKCRLDDYDYIFFSSFDEIPLYFAFLKQKCILVNHANVAALDNVVKRFFLKKLSEKSIFLVFHDFIKNKCHEHGIKDVIVEPIGLSEPYSANILKHTSIFTEMIDRRFVSNACKHLVFVPSGTKYNNDFFEELIQDQGFLQFLKAHQILFLIKDKNIKPPTTDQNVIVIDRFLTSAEYQYLFLRSKSIILSYPDTFNYRISAILFECFSNDKSCFISEIDGFTAFRNHFRYNPFFSDQKSFMKRLEEMVLYPEDLIRFPYKEKQLFTQKFNFLNATTRH